jgi:hypothetical protein
VIFHSYVSLPEGKPNGISWEYRNIIEFHVNIGGNIMRVLVGISSKNHGVIVEYHENIVDSWTGIFFMGI